MAPIQYKRVMATSPIDSQLRSRVDSFVSDLTVLVRQAALEAVQQALGGVPAARGPGRPRGAAKASKSAGGKRGKRSPEQVNALAVKVHAHVKAHPNQSVEQIGKSMGVATKVLKLPIAKLLEAKQLKTKGQRRGTRYFAS